MRRLLVALLLTVPGRGLAAQLRPIPRDTTLAGLVWSLESHNTLVASEARARLQALGPRAIDGLLALARDSALMSYRAPRAMILLGRPGIEALVDALIAGRLEGGLSAFAFTGNDSAAAEILAALQSRLRSPDPKARAVAMHAIPEAIVRSDPALVILLLAAGLRDADPAVRHAAADRLYFAQRSMPELTANLAPLLADSNDQVRDAAAMAVPRLGARSCELTPILAERARVESDRWARAAMIDALGDCGPRAGAAIVVLARLIADTTVRRNAIGAINRIGVDSASPAVVDGIVRDLVAVAVEPTGNEESQLRFDREPAVLALAALGAHGRGAIMTVIGRAADPTVAAFAALTLGTIPQATDATERLLIALADVRDDVRNAAADALGGLGDPVRPRLELLASQGGKPGVAARRGLDVMAWSHRVPVWNRCYAVQPAAWLGGESHEVDSLHVRVLHFTTFPARRMAEGELSFRLVGRFRGPDWSDERLGDWSPTGPTGVNVGFGDGFTGFNAVLHVIDGRLEGDAQYFSDVIGPRQPQARIVALPAPCVQ